MARDINEYAPRSGRVLKEDNTEVNLADLQTTESIFVKKVTVVTAGTLVQLATLTVESVVIKANPANTGKISIHDKAVPAGDELYELEAGEAISFAIDNLNKIFIDATVSGESIFRLAVV